MDTSPCPPALPQAAPRQCCPSNQHRTLLGGGGQPGKSAGIQTPEAFLASLHVTLCSQPRGGGFAKASVPTRGCFGAEVLQPLRGWFCEGKRGSPSTPGLPNRPSGLTVIVQGNCVGIHVLPPPPSHHLIAEMVSKPEISRPPFAQMEHNSEGDGGGGCGWQGLQGSLRQGWGHHGQHRLVGSGQLASPSECAGAKPGMCVWKSSSACPSPPHQGSLWRPGECGARMGHADGLAQGGWGWQVRHSGLSDLAACQGKASIANSHFPGDLWPKKPLVRCQNPQPFHASASASHFLCTLHA